MKVEILYFANFKDITGKDKEIFELVDNSIYKLMLKLFNKYSPIKNLLWDNEINSLKKSVSVVINDKILTNKREHLLELNDGDKVAFLLPFAGG
ncbi:hypothetical protein ES705_21995 [subsurface metagenome]|jgi:MoaD family protein